MFFAVGGCAPTNGQHTAGDVSKVVVTTSDQLPPGLNIPQPNILQTARDAMEVGGTVAIEALEQRPAQERLANKHVEAQLENYHRTTEGGSLALVTALSVYGRGTGWNPPQNFAASAVLELNGAVHSVGLIESKILGLKRHFGRNIVLLLSTEDEVDVKAMDARINACIDFRYASDFKTALAKVFV